MNKFAIISDSVTDLSDAMVKDWNVEIIPFIFTLDNKEYYNHPDWREISVKDYYDALRAGKAASTTQVNQFRYMEIWEPHLQAGKDVLYICLSSALSKSYEQSQLAARELSEKYPDRKIYTIDSKGASVGIGLLAYYATKARDDGKSVDEAAAYVESLVPNLHHWFMVDDLHHLRRGGRISGARAFVGTMLNVKPILHIDNAGKLAPITKARGRTKALELLAKQMTDHNAVPKGQPIFISHSDVPELAEQLKEMITAQHGNTEFFISDIGPVIGAHTGPGTIALIFMGDPRRA
ncbi:MAG: DegV family protein [Defluviitaleaceae bacterium]|nr:DegV family protein [Defluviitaleaceae bacterium]